MADDSGPVAAAPDGDAADDIGSRSDSEVLAAIAAEAGIRRIHFVAWRDLDDPEAGGSELHAHKIASLWAEAGLDITFRTSAVPGAPEALTRDGYRVLRQSGRYAVFPGAAWEGIRMGHRPGDALVEIWNGMPFFSPLWYRGPRCRLPAPRPRGDVGHGAAAHARPHRGRRRASAGAPLLPLESDRHPVGVLADRDHRDARPAPRPITVAPPGIDARYTPGGGRSPSPLVVAVGRLVPVKRFDALLRALAEVKADQPALQAVLIGDGPDRLALEALRDELGATEWVRMPGRVDDDELVSWYRRAWAVASSSQREGWGMTLTEAAACGTPAVATAIVGHTDAVLDGESGLLVDDVRDLSTALGRLLGDQVLRSRLSKGALVPRPLVHVGGHRAPALEALAQEAYPPA